RDDHDPLRARAEALRAQVAPGLPDELSRPADPPGGGRERSAPAARRGRSPSLHRSRGALQRPRRNGDARRRARRRAAAGQLTTVAVRETAVPWMSLTVIST